MFVIPEVAALRAAIPGGARRSDGLNYRTDFVTSMLIKGIRVRGDDANGIANHALK